MSDLIELLVDIFKGFLLLSFIIAISANLIIAAFTSFIAREKNRDNIIWAFLGFFFGLLALLAVGLSPTLEKKR